MTLTLTTPHHVEEKKVDPAPARPFASFLPCQKSVIDGPVTQDLQRLMEEVVQESGRVLTSAVEQVVHTNYQAVLAQEEVNHASEFEISPRDTLLPTRSMKPTISSPSHRRDAGDYGFHSDGTDVQYIGNDATHNNLVLPSLPQLDHYSPATSHPRSVALGQESLRDGAGNTSNVQNKPN
jgi:hypothetical protein